MKSDYYNKYKNIIPQEFLNKENINILEFGVEKGNTTELFIGLSEKNSGSTISVDVIDYANLFKSSNWQFIKSRDDDFEFLNSFISKKSFDIICLDTIHTKKHVKIILEHYFKFLKIGGIFLIDGTSSLPYLKFNYRDNFFSEINNNEIFKYLISLKNNSKNEIDLDFSFEGSGVARIKKKKDCMLEEQKIKSRNTSIKNLLRKILLYFR